jgi:hypothetical protein
MVSASCFNCGQVGHFAWQCPKPKKDRTPRVPASTVSQQRGQIRGPTLRSSRVNDTTVEDSPEGEEVLAGTFLLFGRPIIVLFDSRASHDFMSSTCAKRAKLALSVAKPSYIISTPGGRVVAKQIAREVLLDLGLQVFPTNLIILDEQGIDVIL